MRFFKKIRFRPVPMDAVIKTVRDKRVAVWNDGRGKSRTAEICSVRGETKIKVLAETWSCRYRDGDGQQVERGTGCRDKSAARAMAQSWLDEAERIKAGIIKPEEAKAKSFSCTDVGEHLEGFRASHVAASHSKRHIDEMLKRLERIFKECEVVQLRDLNAERFSRWLAVQASEGMGARTRNLHRTALLGFGTWLINNGRLTGDNPFEKLPVANEKADRRHIRRALRPEEASRLLSVTRLRPLAERGREIVRCKGDKRSNWSYEPLTFENIEQCACRAREKLSAGKVSELEMIGRERELSYRTLLATGLRRGELAAITIANTDLDKAVPCFYLQAGDEKNRKGSTIPLPPELVIELREWIEIKREAFRRRNPVRMGKAGVTVSELPGSEKLFGNVPSINVFNADLQVAGIPKVDERGRVLDIHALRMTFGTWLSTAGVPLRTAQAAMRHSDPKLTANVYTDPQLLDVGGAVKKLPTISLSLPDQDEALKQAAGLEGQVIAADFGMSDELVGNTGSTSTSTNSENPAGEKSENADSSCPLFCPPMSGFDGQKSSFTGMNGNICHHDDDTTEKAITSTTVINKEPRSSTDRGQVWSGRPGSAATRSMLCSAYIVQ